MNQALFTRLLESSQPKAETGCIEWALSMTKDGYGKAKISGKTTRAHRAMWAAVNGDIPAGMLVCHSCDNPKCINIDHLFLGTPKDNMADKVAKGRFRGGPTCWKRPSYGVHHHCAKLNDDMVRNIRRRISSGLNVASIALEFGVGESSIRRIATGETWKHVEGVAA